MGVRSSLISLFRDGPVPAADAYLEKDTTQSPETLPQPTHIKLKGECFKLFSVTGRLCCTRARQGGRTGVRGAGRGNECFT